jgi:hypothetical protein
MFSYYGNLTDVNPVILQKVAEGTATGHSGTVCHFKSFCQLHGHDFPNFLSVAVTQFVLHHIIRQTGFSFFATIKPALTHLERALDHPKAFTPAVDLLLFTVSNNVQSNAEVQ